MTKERAAALCRRPFSCVGATPVEVKKKHDWFGLGVSDSLLELFGRTMITTMMMIMMMTITLMITIITASLALQVGPNLTLEICMCTSS